MIKIHINIEHRTHSQKNNVLGYKGDTSHRTISKRFHYWRGIERKMEDEDYREIHRYLFGEAA